MRVFMQKKTSIVEHGQVLLAIDKDHPLAGGDRWWGRQQGGRRREQARDVCRMHPGR